MGKVNGDAEIIKGVDGEGWNNGDKNMVVEYRHEMRNFVQNLSEYAKGINPKFVIIPQNGPELMTKNGEGTGKPVLKYLNSFDGVGQESFFYGYKEDDILTPEEEHKYMFAFTEIAKGHNKKVMITDYCSKEAYVDNSYDQNAKLGYISFAADRKLKSIPKYPQEPFNVNTCDIVSLADAKNFLYLINPNDQSLNKKEFLNTLSKTSYDILLIDSFFSEDDPLTYCDVERLKTKANGGARLVISYLSIGEAEEYRYYWKPWWKTNNPKWLAEENPDWKGNYKVRYWYKEWQDIIYGNNNSYLKKILDAKFDGAYLDIVDAFEYFEGEL